MATGDKWSHYLKSKQSKLFIALRVSFWSAQHDEFKEPLQRYNCCTFDYHLILWQYLSPVEKSLCFCNLWTLHADTGNKVRRDINDRKARQKDTIHRCWQKIPWPKKISTVVLVRFSLKNQKRGIPPYWICKPFDCAGNKIWDEANPKR